MKIIKKINTTNGLNYTNSHFNDYFKSAVKYTNNKLAVNCNKIYIQFAGKFEGKLYRTLFAECK